MLLAFSICFFNIFKGVPALPRFLKAKWLFFLFLYGAVLAPRAAPLTLSEWQSRQTSASCAGSDSPRLRAIMASSRGTGDLEPLTAAELGVLLGTTFEKLP